MHRRERLVVPQALVAQRAQAQGRRQQGQSRQRPPLLKRAGTRLRRRLR